MVVKNVDTYMSHIQYEKFVFGKKHQQNYNFEGGRGRGRGRGVLAQLLHFGTF